MQLTVKQLKEKIESLPDNLPVFFRRIAPICGTIEAAYSANLDEYSFFGIVEPCLILEPSKDEGGNLQ